MSARQASSLARRARRALKVTKVTKATPALREPLEIKATLEIPVRRVRLETKATPATRASAAQQATSSSDSLTINARARSDSERALV